MTLRRGRGRADAALVRDTANGSNAAAITTTRWDSFNYRSGIRHLTSRKRQGYGSVWKSSPRRSPDDVESHARSDHRPHCRNQPGARALATRSALRCSWCSRPLRRVAFVLHDLDMPFDEMARFVMNVRTLLD
jgi:hypothetical protein